MVTNSQSLAIQQRSVKIAQELVNEGFDGWMTALAIMGWMLSCYPKPIADELIKGLEEALKQFPGYPK